LLRRNTTTATHSIALLKTPAFRMVASNPTPFIQTRNQVNRKLWLSPPRANTNPLKELTRGASTAIQQRLRNYLTN
jgi:hypothetical protein